VPSNRTVWKAKVDLSAGIAGDSLIKYGDTARALADGIVSRLSQDGILRSCASPLK